MKIEVTTTKRVKESIEVKFPYYYIHNLTNCDYEKKSVIFGKKTESEEITIHEIIRDKKNYIYEIEKDTRNDSYFSDEYKSTKEQYEKAEKRLKQFLKNIL